MAFFTPKCQHTHTQLLNEFESMRERMCITVIEPIPCHCHWSFWHHQKWLSALIHITLLSFSWHIWVVWVWFSRFKVNNKLWLIFIRLTLFRTHLMRDHIFGCVYLKCRHLRCFFFCCWVFAVFFFSIFLFSELVCLFLAWNMNYYGVHFGRFYWPPDKKKRQQHHTNMSLHHDYLHVNRFLFTEISSFLTQISSV